MDSDLIVLIAVGAIAVWLFRTLLEYVKIKSNMSLAEQDEGIFGKGTDPQFQRFRLFLVPRVSTPQSLLAFVLAIFLVAYIAHALGVL